MYIISSIAMSTLRSIACNAVEMSFTPHDPRERVDNM